MKSSVSKSFGFMVLAAWLLIQPSLPNHSFAQALATHQDTLRMKWWADSRFGMFIHWGIYAVPAHAEWYMNDGHVPRATYQEYAKEFDPTEFHADTWVKIAKDAGMKYLVITSKHHDGFSMFKTKATDYNVVKDTPWHKDPLRALSAACRKYGIHFGVYYSIMDWHSRFQGASDPDPEHPTYNPTHFKPDEKQAYIRYMKNQLKELVTQYHPQILWFDGQWMEGWTDDDGKEIYDYLRKIDPNLIINDRVKGAGDYETPEQQIPPNGFPGHYWETCMTINNSWGYNAVDHDFKSSETLIRNLIDIASKGGNYLLNVGPTAMGVIPRPEVARLDTMGAWLRMNGEAIYGTTASPFTTRLSWGRCTQKPGKLFLEVFDWPDDGQLVVHGVYNKPDRAFILSDKKRTPLRTDTQGDSVVVWVPAAEPDKICTVIELNFNGTPEIYNPPEIEPRMRLFVDSMEFTIKPTSDAEIRFTLDGTIPSAEALVYSEPIRITDSTTVIARYFRDGKPVSGVSRAAFLRVVAQPAVDVKEASNGVDYRYFVGRWSAVPEFRHLKPVREGVIPVISLPADRAAQYYGLEYTGYVKIPKDGVYTFYISSDDGSMLYIGDRLVVDNDGLHASVEKSGTIALSAGYHPIRVDYFQSQGGVELQVEFSGPGIVKQTVPGSALYFRK